MTLVQLSDKHILTYWGVVPIHKYKFFQMIAILRIHLPLHHLHDTINDVVFNNYWSPGGVKFNSKARHVMPQPPRTPRIID